MTPRLLTDYTRDGATIDRNMARFARSVTTVYGATSGHPKWFISAAASVDATTTKVTVAHGIGTDFTPAAGITGFQISGDNGASWMVPSAAVRADATTIILTHPPLATTPARRLRYQYGAAPDTRSAVHGQFPRWRHR